MPINDNLTTTDSLVLYGDGAMDPVVANITGNGLADLLVSNFGNNLGNDFGSSTPAVVSGGGLVPTTLSGVGIANITADGANITVDGTTGPDSFTVTPTDNNSATITNNTTSPQRNTTDGATLTIDPLAGNDTVTVVGTSVGNTVNVVNNAATTTVGIVGFQTVGVVTGHTEALVVQGGLGSDTINVSGTGGPSLTVNGGLPENGSGVQNGQPGDVLNITNTNNGATTVMPGATDTSGTITTPDGTTSFENIEMVNLTAAAAADTLLMDGTTGSDLIKLYNNGAANEADVNQQARVLFSVFGTVSLDGIAGNDTFNVTPVGLAGVSTVNVTGEYPNGSAAVIVNGTAGNDTITTTATGTTTATVQVGTFGAGNPVINLNPVSSLTINGMDGNDTFNLTNTVAPLSAPITLNGDAGNDTFQIGSYQGAVLLDGGVGSDTVDFSQSPQGVTIDLDSTNVAQKVSPTTGLSVTLLNPIENFVGSPHDDIITVDAMPVARSIDGGLPNVATTPSGTPTDPIPPGDTLIVDGMGQFVNFNRTVAGAVPEPSADSGTITAFGYQPVTFTHIEKWLTTNTLNAAGFDTGNQPAYTSAVDYPTIGFEPRAIVTGELRYDTLTQTGTTWQDMVVANSGLNWTDSGTAPTYLNVYLGNGNGTFQIPKEIATNLHEVFDIQLADMDGDGLLDVVVAGLIAPGQSGGPLDATGEPAIEWFKGDGTGNFTLEQDTGHPLDQGPRDHGHRQHRRRKRPAATGRRRRDDHGSRQEYRRRPVHALCRAGYQRLGHQRHPAGRPQP